MTRTAPARRPTSRWPRRWPHVAERTRGMGRGLSALLAPAELGGGEHESDLRQIPLELIKPNPHQPRQEFDESALLALADSIRERGVLQPVLVRPVYGGTYELVAGERRWRGAQLAGVEAVPARLRPQEEAAALRLAVMGEMGPGDPNPDEGA